MELKDLVGKHILSGVEIGKLKVDNYGYLEDAQSISFILDGTTYTAIEDPDDGYRSAMRELKVSETPLQTTLPDIEVTASYREKGSWGKDDILELRDVKNGNVVLEVGTESTDDYYPCFICSWSPEKLSINSGK